MKALHRFSHIGAEELRVRIETQTCLCKKKMDVSLDLPLLQGVAIAAGFTVLITGTAVAIPPDMAKVASA